ncbi:MAG: hypothetical protein HYV42_05000 [Candidatus Magasanikbacteria bacterium]|nr:hypothetical protein [Candidatus Magasanikbacteria bacterium]
MRRTTAPISPTTKPSRERGGLIPRLLPALLLILLAAWFGFFFWHPIDLIPADLGRHLTNGRIFLTEPANRAALLHTNFYSSATPEAPFVNHHWLTGVVFFAVFKLGGFPGLGLFHLLVNLATFFLFFRLAVQRGGFRLATLLTIVAVPLLAERTEIRPEIFSYLSLALYATILDGYLTGRWRARVLALLVPVQIFWVNSHIYFFLGPALVGLYWLLAWGKKLPRPGMRRPLALLLAGTIGGSIINPSGLAGLFFPLKIFGNYAFVISENQSVRDFFAAGRPYPNIWSFLVFALAVLIVALIIYWKNRPAMLWGDQMLALLFGLWSVTAVRNFTLFGYAAVIALSGGLAAWRPAWGRQRFGYLFIGAILIAALAGFSRVRTLIPETRLGVVKDNEGAADFIRAQDIKGPLFNDLDIGGYAIFHLYPALRPFVDNRPEAYPGDFLRQVFVPMQANPEEWNKQLARFNFNVILYSFEDRAPWAIPFIVNRLLDPAWAPVYADNFAIVLVRRNEQNAELIKKYEISKERFSLQQTK